jgi:hypothetical protein
LAWDDLHWLYLLNRAGERQAQLQAPAPLTAICSADDGTSYAVAGTGGQVWLLAPDLMPRWERALPRPVVAIALDPFGQYVAVADDSGNLHLFDRHGRPVAHASSPRPLHYLAFVPERPALVASADFGQVACFDLAGRCRWRDGLVANVGSLAVSGSGSLIALACFSEGLCCYGLEGPNRRLAPMAEPCRLAALSYDGGLILTAGLDHRLRLHDRDGKQRGEWMPNGAVTALALGPLGDYAIVGLAAGKLVGLESP